MPRRVGIAALAVLCCGLVGCTSTVDGQAHRNPVATPVVAAVGAMVSPDRLDSLLLSSAEANAAMGATAMTISDDTVGLYLDNPDEKWSNPECQGAAFVGLQSTYEGSGYLEARIRRLKEPGDTVDHIVVQAAMAYPTADAAGASVDNAAKSWAACGGKNTVREHHGHAPSSTNAWSIGTPSNSDGITTTLNYQEAGGGWRCARSLSASSNVLLDISACGYGTTVADGVAVMTKALSKLPR